MINGTNNRVRLNTFYGNGAATSKDSPSATNSNNYGLGLFGASQNNLIEKNKIGGNINGLYLGAEVENSQGHPISPCIQRAHDRPPKP